MRSFFISAALAALLLLAAQTASAQDAAQTGASPVPQASPAQPPADKLTLEEAVRMALGEHPRVKAASEDVSAGRYRTLEARATYWPQITFDASRNHIWLERPIRIGTTPVAVKASYIANNFTFNGNWTLFDFGRTYYRVKSARELVDSLIADLDASKQAVAYDVMEAYFGLLRSQSLVRVNKETLDLANKNLEQAKAFFEVGTKPRFDVTSAEVEVNNAEVGVITAEDAVRAARIRLNTRIGVSPLAPTEVLDMPATEKLEKPLDDYIREALANRPELLSLADRVLSNEMLTRSEWAGHLPTLSTSAQYNWYKEDHTDYTNNSNVLLAVNVPIFEGGRTYARVGQARAAALASRYRLEDARLSVMDEVSQAFIAVQDANARLVALEVSVRSARENLDIAQGRYEAGVGAIIDVTNAQVSLTSAQADQAQAFYDYHIAYSRLLRSVGVRAGVRG